MKRMVMLITGLWLIAAVGMTEGKREDSEYTTLNAGMNMTRGNSDVVMLNVGLESGWKKDTVEVKMGGEGAYGKAEEDVTAKNMEAYIMGRRGKGTYFLSSDISVLRDEVIYVDYRLISGFGTGSHLIKTENTDWTMEWGVAYIREALNEDREKEDMDVLPKREEPEENVFAFRFIHHFEHQIGESAYIWQTMKYFPEMDNIDAYLFNLEAGIDANINEQSSLRVVFEDKYDSQPAWGLEENDMTLTYSIVIEL